MRPRCPRSVLLSLAVVAGSGVAQAAPIEPVLERAEAVELDFGTRWQARRDPAAGVARVASGPALHLLAHADPAPAELDAAARSFLDRNASLFGARARELELVAVEPVGGLHEAVSYRQIRGGLPVLGGRVTLLFRGPALVVVSSTAEAAPLAAGFDLDEASARDLVWASLDAEGAPADRTLATSRRVLVRVGAELRPAWDLVVATTAPLARTRVVVDASSGAIVRRLDLFPREVVQVVVDAAPGAPAAAPVRQPLPAWSTAADPDGRADVSPGSIDVRLSGPRVGITDALAATAANTFPVAAASGPGVVQLPWPAGDAPQEQLDGFVWGHRAIEYGRDVAPDMPWLSQPLGVHVNFDDGSGFPYCNAFYIPRTFTTEPTREATHFFRAGGDDTIQCVNTASLPSVVLHEWGHGLHDHLLPAGLIGEDAAEGSISEGVGDFVSASVLNDPRIPLDKLVTATSPTQIPARLADNDLRYPDDLRQGGDGLPDVHWNGQIWSGTFWDLRGELILKYGPHIGVRMTDQLHADVLRGSPSWTTAYDLAIALDDDDGDPTNGSPNSCEITSAFAAHGLAPADAVASGSLRLQHQPDIAIDSPDAATIIAAITAPAGCGALDAASVELTYSLNGTAPATMAMTADGSSFQATIPGLADGVAASYTISASTQDGHSYTWPADGGRFGRQAGTPEALASFGFEDGGAGWTHGADAAIADDWQFGTPTGRAGDPFRAAGGVGVAGNDLGTAGNGAYDPGGTTWLESPPVDCGDCSGLSVRFRRWLTVGSGDVARLRVGDAVIWESSGELRDSAWTVEEIPLGDVFVPADGLRVRFEIESDGSGEAGGWNLDDVTILNATTGPGGPGGPGGGSGDIVGSCSAAGDATGPLPLLVLALALGLVVRRRRAQRARS